MRLPGSDEKILAAMESSPLSSAASSIRRRVSSALISGAIVSASLISSWFRSACHFDMLKYAARAFENVFNASS